MPRYKISNRVPDIWCRAEICRGVAFPFHLLFPPRFATDEQFAAELKQRLKAIPYPYELARAQRNQPDSTYDLLRKRGALDSLFQPPVMKRLRLWIESYEEWSEIRHLRFAGTEAGKKFRDFHVPLAKDLARHVNVLRKLSASYDLAEEWIGPYIRTVEEQLMLEIVLLRSCTEDKTESDSEAIRNTVNLVYSDVARAFKTANIANQALCFHVTSVICSPNCLITKTLSLTPESVRKLIERDPVKKKNKSSN